MFPWNWSPRNPIVQYLLNTRYCLTCIQKKLFCCTCAATVYFLIHRSNHLVSHNLLFQYVILNNLHILHFSFGIWWYWKERNNVPRNLWCRCSFGYLCIHFVWLKLACYECCFVSTIPQCSRWFARSNIVLDSMRAVWWQWACTINYQGYSSDSMRMNS